MSKTKAQYDQQKKVASASDPDLTEQMKRVLETAENKRTLEKQRKAKVDAEESILKILAFIGLLAFFMLLKYFDWI